VGESVTAAAPGEGEVVLERNGVGVGVGAWETDIVPPPPLPPPPGEVVAVGGGENDREGEDVVDFEMEGEDVGAAKERVGVGEPRALSLLERETLGEAESEGERVGVGETLEEIEPATESVGTREPRFVLEMDTLCRDVREKERERVTISVRVGLGGEVEGEGLVDREREGDMVREGESLSQRDTEGERDSEGDRVSEGKPVVVGGLGVALAPVFIEGLPEGDFEKEGEVEDAREVEGLAESEMGEPDREAEGERVRVVKEEVLRLRVELPPVPVAVPITLPGTAILPMAREGEGLLEELPTLEGVRRVETLLVPVRALEGSGEGVAPVRV